MGNFIQTVIFTLFLVLQYYVFSIGLTFYNKRVVTKFNFPLIMTYIHLLVKFSLASLVRNIMECRRHKERVYVGWKTSLTVMAPVGITSILDIGLSNWSFEYITVSLYTMTKTTAIVFLLIFAILLKVEEFNWLQVVVVLLISLGLFLFTYESTQFNAVGFVMCLSASALSGLRWSLTQKIAQKDELGLSNPVDMMYHIQPWMALGLLPFAVGVEGLSFSIDDHFLAYKNIDVLVNSMLILLAGALLAFGLEFSEFLFVKRTSSLTLSVSAMAKEVCILLLAHQINGDEMNSMNIGGLIACLLGIMVHVYIKYRKSRNELEKQYEAQHSDQTVGLLDSESDASESQF